MTVRETIFLEAPLTKDTLNFLHSGDQVQIFGVIYTARDAAHERMWKARITSYNVCYTKLLRISIGVNGSIRLAVVGPAEPMIRPGGGGVGPT